MLQKERATAAKVAAMYQPQDSGTYELTMDGETIRLCSKSILGPPRVEDLIKTAMNPPFWDRANNRPIFPPEVYKVVDHRANQTPVKKQGDRATCVAFAAMAQIEAVIKANEQQDVDLSEQYAYWLFMNIDGRDQCNDMLLTTDVATYLTDHGICEEALCPYEDRNTVTKDCAQEPSPEAKNNAKYGITDYKTISSMGDYNITNLDYIEAILCGGHDIVVGLELALVDVDHDGLHDVWLDETGKRALSLSRTDATPGNAPGHAMLLVGYDKTSATKPFFIMKNSWGPDRGDHGYFYLTYDYFKTYAKVGYIITGVSADKHANI
jgi:Cysteine protease